MTGNQGLKTQKMAWKTALEREEKNLEFTDEGNTATITTSDLNQNDITPDSKENIELLDTLAVEKQRGITVKATTASMLYPHPCAVGPEKVLLLNLIDTPGHVDFGREVTRTLAFVQGAVLLLDATQGIQAQTWSVYDKAKSLPNPPTLLMALTKVDLPTARPIHYSLQVSEFLEWDPDDIILTSARNRINIKKILDAVCERIPPPKPLADDTPNNSFLRAQVVDSRYDDRGVNCLVYVVSGELNEGDRIAMVSVSGEVVQQQQTSFSVQEVGIVLPKAHRTGSLQRGQMGYVRFGLRDPRQAMPGTILIWNSHVNKINEIILPEMPMSAATTNTKSVLYASVHPAEADGFEELTSAVDRLALNDTGLEVSKTSSIGSESSGPFLGPGLRVGFQGLLHVEVFRQRLQDEFNIDAVVTPPKVPYKITISPSQRSGVKEESVKLVEDLKDWVSSYYRIVN
jgi:GTP-binding protein LepA